MILRALTALLALVLLLPRRGPRRPTHPRGRWRASPPRG